ncbi:MAG: alpha/beta fold hydrolase [Candidatus Magasanikbacteria bacterium]
MPTLVILPGWGGNKETWGDFLSYLENNPLEKKVNIKVLELPCFGDVSCPDEVWGVKEYAEFVKKNIQEELDEDTVHLLGHSFGGAVAAKLCSRHPGLVDNLILSGPAIIRPERRFKRFVFSIISKFGKILFKLPMLEKFGLMCRRAFYRIIDTDYPTKNKTKRKIFKKIVRQDQKETLSKIKNDTLIIWGENDNIVDPEDSLKILPELKNSYLCMIKNGGHGLHLNSKRKLRNKINKFLS